MNKGRDVISLGLNINELVKESEGFSGAEIEEVISEAMFIAFDNGQKDVSNSNLLECIAKTCPLSKTMFETISNLRKWAKERARFASDENPTPVKAMSEEVPILEQEYSNPFIKKNK